MNIKLRKKQARDAAFGRRKDAFSNQHYDLVQDMMELAIDHQVVATYMAMRTEIDPQAAMEALILAGKRVAVPVIQGASQPLVFHEWTIECEMTEGEFGARIPQNTPILIPDLVFAPLVAFDAQGTRLGYGGGFYDRTMEQLRKACPTAYIGLAFDEQKSNIVLPLEATDIPLDGVLTQHGFQSFPLSRS